MNIVWRYISASRNTYASLFAACEKYGVLLEPADAETVFDADIVCYSLNSLNYHEYLDEMQSLDAIVIAGGPHPSACFQDVLETADYVVVGEGERSLPCLLSTLSRGLNPTGIPGIASKSGYVPLNYSVRLDAFPCFTRMKGYIELTRGCPFHCGYCQTPRLHGSTMRHRSREEIVKAASYFKDARFVTPNAFAYGSSDGIHPAPDKLQRLLSSLSENNIYLGTFPSEVRPEFVLEETAELVVQYCANTNLHFGAQSGSDTVLKKLHRGHGISEVYHALDVCRDFHLTPVVDIIFGFPFETDEDEEKSLSLVEEIVRRGKVHVHYLTPLPGTPLAGTVSRPILPEIDKRLGQLALHGHITGYWHDKVFS